MNFYQKMYGLATLLFMGMTALIIYAFFELPYSRIFQTEIIAILSAELLVGLCVVHNVRKKDSALFHAAGYTVTAIVYLLFVLFMTYVACGDILPFRFIAVHISGFVMAVILMIFFFIAEHHLTDQEQAEKTLKTGVLEFRNDMEEIVVSAGLVFTGNPSLLKEIRGLADETRFLPDPTPANAALDREIESVVAVMKKALQTKDQTVFTAEMEHLRTLFRARESRF